MKCIVSNRGRRRITILPQWKAQRRRVKKNLISLGMFSAHYSFTFLALYHSRAARQ